MAFLAKADLSLSILVQELDEITRSDNAIVAQALSSAEAEMRSWLYDSYDVDDIFSKTGSSRHPVILQSGVDIAVWRIVAACQAGINLDDRETRYNNAIAWLRQVKKAENYADLPRRAETVQKHIGWGSKTKKVNSY